MKEWFEQLAPRERLLVAIAGGFAIFALVVMLGIRPIMSQSKRGHELVEDKRELLAELRDVAARFGPQRGSAGRGAAGDQRPHRPVPARR